MAILLKNYCIDQKKSTTPAAFHSHPKGHQGTRPNQGTFMKSHRKRCHEDHETPVRSASMIVFYQPCSMCPCHLPIGFPRPSLGIFVTVAEPLLEAAGVVLARSHPKTRCWQSALCMCGLWTNSFCIHKSHTYNIHTYTCHYIISLI